ncbi:MAG: Sua5/YciO/YrdC/YwlC family protein, partial [Chloroflexota bacterium]
MPDQNTDPHRPIERRHVHVDGVVQGVGFRPFIYGLAARFGLSGWVLNSSSGVDVEVQGAVAALDAFQEAITAEAPPLARIDPADRRYRYPFTNCTNCGPRYTIIRAMPYDRPQTTMAGFPMCPDCQAEYHDPLDRRFHAQPNACPVCGPHVTLVADGELTATLDPSLPDDLARAAALLRGGAILAVKGLGGFHLACDATNAEAVARLRERKSRPDKPFAVMIASLDEVRGHCTVNEDEAALLSGPSAPIVLLYRRPESSIAPNVAPDNPMLGVVLPYTPLHHILMRDAGCPLVMTSGNLGGLPVIADDAEAQEKLAHIADAFL